MEWDGEESERHFSRVTGLRVLTPVDRMELVPGMERAG